MCLFIRNNKTPHHAYDTQIHFKFEIQHLCTHHLTYDLSQRFKFHQRKQPSLIHLNESTSMIMKHFHHSKSHRSLKHGSGYLGRYPLSEILGSLSGLEICRLMDLTFTKQPIINPFKNIFDSFKCFQIGSNFKDSTTTSYFIINNNTLTS